MSAAVRQAAAHAAFLRAKAALAKAPRNAGLKAAAKAAESELAAAAKAVAAEKRAAQPAGPTAEEVRAKVAAHNAQQDSQRAEFAAAGDLQRRVKAAALLYLAAQDWPRQGEGWPKTPAEKTADAVLREHARLADALMGGDWHE